MCQDKPKKKRTPRKCRYLIPIILTTLLIGLGMFAFPTIEALLLNWLADDPLTPMCYNDELAVAYTSSPDGMMNLYHMRLNDKQTTQISELSDPLATSFRQTTDGQYLIHSMSNATPNQLHFYHYETGQTKSVALPDPQFNWYILPDNSAVIVWMRYSQQIPDAKFQIDLPVTDTTEAEPISFMPNELFASDFRMEQMSGSTLISPMNSGPYTDSSQVKFSPSGDYVATTQQTATRAGVNQGFHIVVYKTKMDEQIWQIKKLEPNYDVKHTIQDISLTNDLLYFRSYFLMGDNNIHPDMPYEAFIADIETQTLTSILEDRPHEYIRNLRWSPDNRVMFIALENWETRTIDVYLGDYAGGNRTAVISLPFDNYSLGGFQWTPDGQYLSYVAMNDWLYLLDLETRHACRVAKGRTDNRSTHYEWRLITTISQDGG